MCGIAGAFSFRPEAEPVNIAVVERINQAQRRIGPDGEGHWESSNSRIALAHRRLAIIDTGQSGAQPMTDATGRWTITFKEKSTITANCERTLSAPASSSSRNAIPKSLLMRLQFGERADS